MARDVEVRVDGLRELRRDLKRLEPAVDKELRVEIKRAAGRVAVEAAALAPRRTGALAKSIRPYVSGARASIASTLPYAGVVHWGGTIRPRGAPITFRATEFISKAVERNADRLVEDIGDAVEQAALRAGWHR